jgi:hypothetical protein
MKITSKTRLFSLLSLALALFASPLAHAEKAEEKAQKSAVDPAKEKAIRHLMKISKSAEAGQMILDGMKEAMQRNMPSATADFWKNFPTQEILAEFEDALVVIYDKHLTMEEIRALTQFYESPVGKSILDKLRVIGMESAAAGQDLSAKIVQRVLERTRGAGDTGH